MAEKTQGTERDQDFLEKFVEHLGLSRAQTARALASIDGFLGLFVEQAEQTEKLSKVAELTDRFVELAVLAIVEPKYTGSRYYPSSKAINQQVSKATVQLLDVANGLKADELPEASRHAVRFALTQLPIHYAHRDHKDFMKGKAGPHRSLVEGIDSTLVFGVIEAYKNSGMVSGIEGETAVECLSSLIGKVSELSNPGLHPFIVESPHVLVDNVRGLDVKVPTIDEVLERWR